MMKRLLSAILCVLLIISLSGCKNEPAKYDSRVASSITETVETTSIDVTSGEQEDEKSDDITIKETESATTEESDLTSETKSTTAEKETTEKAEPPTQKVEETKPQPKPTETQTEQKPKEEPVKETTTATEPAVTETPYVRPSAAEVEQAVVKYVNQYRIAQGDTQTTVLTGLTNVARYRAKQLTTNFAHTDIREVCAELKYGKYVDLTEYGHPETDNYYEGRPSLKVAGVALRMKSPRGSQQDSRTVQITGDMWATQSTVIWRSAQPTMKLTTNGISASV